MGDDTLDPANEQEYKEHLAIQTFVDTVMGSLEIHPPLTGDYHCPCFSCRVNRQHVRLKSDVKWVK